MNKIYRRLLVSLFICVLFSTISLAQEQGASQQTYDPQEIEKLKAQVKELINFFEYTINTLGDKKTSTREKEIIINQSFAKIFLNEEVQVEDDLDENREIIINKDVQAYLKDIDFFFKEVEFKYNIDKIDPSYNADKELFFIVTLNRNLKGITITSDSVNNNLIRYIEVNFDDMDRDLRIASIYTNKLNEFEELSWWWQGLSKGWKNYVGGDIFIRDSLKLSEVIAYDGESITISSDTIKLINYDTVLVYGTDSLVIEEVDTVPATRKDTIAFNTNIIYQILRRVTNEKDVSLENNMQIEDLSPLSQFSELRRLNCSNTLINDISPIRNLSKLEVLECDQTLISQLNPLKYSINLRTLSIENTRVHHIDVVSNLVQLETLHFSNTTVSDLAPVAELKQLKDIRFANTLVSDLGPLSNLKNLELVNLSRTGVTDLSPLSGAQNLKRLYSESNRINDYSPLQQLPALQTLYLDNSTINSLGALDNLEDLRRIYCDNTNITKTEANQFMLRNPDVLVIYESEELIGWWHDLSVDWKMVFSNYIDLNPDAPTKEEIHQVANITELDISHNGRLDGLDPLRKLSQLTELTFSYTMIENLEPLSDLVDLKHIHAAGTKIKDLSPLKDLINLEYINISETEVGDISPLKGMNNLHTLEIDKTRVSTILPLAGLKGLTTIYGNESGIDDEQFVKFSIENPDCLVIYKPDQLISWWYGLSSPWKSVFRQMLEIEDDPDAIQLHRLIKMREVDITDNKNLRSLEPLTELKLLKTIKFSGTQITDLKPLREFKYLEHVELSNNPIEDLEIISEIENLKHFEMQNIPVKDIDFLVNSSKLEVLNCAGTEIKDLKALEYAYNLEKLYIYNTRVNNLKHIEGLKNLRLLECYNTRLSDRRISNFKESVPNCEVVFY